MLSVNSINVPYILEEVEDIFNPELFIDKSYSVKTVCIEDLELQLYALHSATTTDHDLTGQIVWPAAKLLATFLLGHHDLCSNAGSVIELGSGVGLSGLVAARLCSTGSRVLLTDNNELVLELLHKNVDINFADKQSVPVDCCYLTWGRDEAENFSAVHGDFDLILGADVVFWPTAVPLLFETVNYFLSRRPTAKFVLSYINRSEFTTKLLFDAARGYNMKWQVFDAATREHLQSTTDIQPATVAAASIIIFTLDVT